MLFAVVEGRVDAAVAERVARHTNVLIDQILIKNGRANIASKVRGYAGSAVQEQKWFVLADLDSDPCPSDLLGRWGVPARSAHFTCRFAVREVEAWLLSDAETLAQELHVSQSALPPRPEELRDAKLALVNAARRSRRRSVREALTPPPTSLLQTGPDYTPWIIDYVQRNWRPGQAALISPSLRKCMTSLTSLFDRLV